MKNRKAYIKKINSNLYHVCLEYGKFVKIGDLPITEQKERDLNRETELKVRRDLILGRFDNLNNAIKFRSEFNNPKKNETT